ncbi:hypothetical protein AAVH_22438 [Aphelenchoides avenae]|nr:hypothetical protein AAVH_22438 [Aphelenchus avenae]
MRATKSVLQYIMAGRRGSLCWLSSQKYSAFSCDFLTAIIKKFQAQTGVGSFEHPLFLQFPYRPFCRSSEAGCIENQLGPQSQISVDGIDLRNIARFYPNSTTTFDYHVMRAGDKYKSFVLENASGQRVFVVASDDDASMMDGTYWLQRVAFVPDLAILRD